MQDFYLAKARAKEWNEDVRWLQRDWSRADTESVEFFGIETGNLSASVLARQCVESARSTTLRTAYRALGVGPSVQLHEIAGSLGRSRMLNDAVIDIGCRLVVDTRKDDTIMFGSHFFTNGFSKTPRLRHDKKKIAPLVPIKFVIAPVHLPAHWGVFIVELDLPHAVAIHAYESQNDPDHRQAMQTMCKESLIPFLRLWHQKYEKQRVKERMEYSQADYEEAYKAQAIDGGRADAEWTPVHLPPTMQSFPSARINWITQPVQCDGTSCGIMVLAMVYSIVRGSRLFPATDQVSRECVSTLRLRLLWMLLCSTFKEHPDRGGMEAIDDAVASEFPPED